MSNDDIIHIIIPLAVLLCLVIGFIVLKGSKKSRIDKRIARVTNRKAAVQKTTDVLYIRRKSSDGVPLIGKILSTLPSQAVLRTRLERAGLTWPADVYVTVSVGVAALITIMIMLFHKSLALGLLAGILVGIAIPHCIIGNLGSRRIKKFLILFPDAIEFIVRGLRSGLPVTESMNMVSTEMEEPVRSVFFGIGEAVRLGVPVEKSLQDTAAKLDTTEFNFFVTSIILQRETGGNLSEILSNLADVLRKRFMMRMKIKAMASEAKASALIVGALPFVVIIALLFVSPGYLDPFVDDIRGNLAAAGGMTSMALGLFVMYKMTQFEI